VAKNRKRSRGRRSDQGPIRAFGSTESKAAEFMTVGWLLTALTTLVCELGAAAAFWFARRDPEALSIAALALVLMFAALVTGLLSLLLLAAAWKLRSTKPPRGITVFAIFVSLAPVAMLAVMRLTG
jgi:hypothetical protein